jgi:DUF1707 SHOCT-like domain
VDRRSSLRASDADRERIVDRLHTAATEGRIAAEELEQRVHQALTARTYAELESTIVDLPGPRELARQGQRPRRSTAGWAFAAARHNPLLLVVAIPIVAVTFALVLAATIVWLVMALIVIIIGGRRSVPRQPWLNSWRPSWGPPWGPPGAHWREVGRPHGSPGPPHASPGRDRHWR